MFHACPSLRLRMLPPSALLAYAASQTHKGFAPCFPHALRFACACSRLMQYCRFLRRSLEGLLLKGEGLGCFLSRYVKASTSSIKQIVCRAANQKAPLCKGSCPEGAEGLITLHQSNYITNKKNGNPSGLSGHPSGPLAGRACSTLWLKMCHWHIFLTRRALCTREAFTSLVKLIACRKPTKRLPLEGKLSPKVTDEVAVCL